jgi:hypothetical protein
MALSTTFSFAATGGSLATDPAAPQQNQNHFAGTEDHVRIVSVTRDPADSNKITVTLQIDPGYHVNANPASDKYLIPTTLTFDGPQPSHVIYPASTSFQAKFAEKPIDVYQGAVKIIATFPEGTLTTQTRLRGNVLAQACTDEICLPPANIAVSE